MNEVILTLVVLALGYLLGCISTGILISRKAGVNIRNVGSQNTGASNVLRVLGVRKGLITFFGDALKAVLACWIGGFLLPGGTFGIEGFGIMIGGLAVVAGHNWPCFFSFKGGKGVACSTAVIMFYDPLLGGIAVALCIIIIAVTRYISVGSMAMLFSYFVMMCAFHYNHWFACVFAAILLLVVVIRHRENIKRLTQGTENKIGKRVKPADETEA